jgi:predicted HNH restriction endonuclease
MCAEASRRWRQKNPEKVLAQKAKYYERNKIVIAARRAPGNLERSKALRAKALEVFGSVCGSCGFSDVRALQIDHVNGGGGAERAVIKSRHSFYNKVIADSTGYQLLCANCNWIKRAENKEYRWENEMSAAARIKTTSTITED